MGLGGYLAACSESEHYFSEHRREEQEILEKPAVESLEMAEIFADYDLTETEYAPIIAGLRRQPAA